MNILKCIGLCTAILSASATAGELTVAAGPDVGHSTGSAYFETRYSAERWKHWSVYLGGVLDIGRWSGEQGSRFSPRVGAELYETFFSGRLIAGLGLTVASQNDIVGTSLRYSIRLEWLLTNGLSVGLMHESNCSSVCDNSLMRWLPHGPKSKPNLGYNFLVVRVPLR